MKKLTAVLLVLVCMGGNVWAADTGKISLGATALSLGLTTCIMTYYLIPGGEDAPLLYGIGGGVAILGLLVMIGGAVSDGNGYAKAVEENPVLKHVSLATTGEQTYVGFRFSF
jgi:hypothetical protein